MDTRFKKGQVAWNKKEHIKKNCPVCDTDFSVRPSLDRIRFCSMSCARKGTPSNRFGKKASEETRLKQRLAKLGIRGEKHWNWKNGGVLRKERHTLMQRDEYKQWRLSVFKRDNFTCVFCGDTSRNIHADHIKPWVTHVEIRYDLNNGRTLCIPCHKKTPTYGSRALKTQVGG